MHCSLLACNLFVWFQKEVNFLFVGTRDSIDNAKMMLNYHLSHLEVCCCLLDGITLGNVCLLRGFFYTTCTAALNHKITEKVICFDNSSQRLAQADVNNKFFCRNSINLHATCQCSEHILFKVFMKRTFNLIFLFF